jgi:hypothetical protein
MTRKLNESDRAAVDLIFDRMNAAATTGGRSTGNGHDGNGGGVDGVYAATGAVSEERLAAVQKVLSLLDEMPAIEPPADLAVRTLAGVNRTTGVSVPAIAPQPFIDPTQPLA